MGNKRQVAAIGRMRLFFSHLTQSLHPSVTRPALVGPLCALVILACAHNPGQQPVAGDQTGHFFYDHVIDVYSGPLDHLQAVRHGQCPMHPSCSQYSRQAIARFGFVKGWVMTMDRLMRCGRDETRLAPKVMIEGQWKYVDPVDDNAF